MKKIAKLLIWIVGSLAVIFLVASIIFALFGKSIIISSIEKNLKRKVTMERINISFPLTADIRKLDIQGLAKIESLSLRPSVLGILAGKIILNELNLINPEITLEMDSQGKLNIPQGGKAPVLIAGLDIKDGKLIFIDKKVDPAGYKVVVNNINASIHKASFPPTSLMTKFTLGASLGEGQDTSGGTLTAGGWVDFGPKDMDARLELKDIDLSKLAPYYSKFISEKKLTAGRLNFTSDLKAENNDLTAQCKAAFTNLSFLKEAPAEGEEQKVDVASELLNLFSDDTGTIAFDFTLRTKLDNPKINPKELQNVFGMAAAQNIANQPPEKIIEKGKELGEQFEAIGKQFKEMFKKKEE